MREEPNYNYWLACDYWTIDESCFLLSGLTPKGDFFNVDIYFGVTGHYSKIDRENLDNLKNLINGSVESGKLKNDHRFYKNQCVSFEPQNILKWVIEKNLCEVLEIPVPVQLVEWYEAQPKAPPPVAIITQQPPEPPPPESLIIQKSTSKQKQRESVLSAVIDELKTEQAVINGVYTRAEIWEKCLKKSKKLFCYGDETRKKFFRDQELIKLKEAGRPTIK